MRVKNNGGGWACTLFYDLDECSDIHFHWHAAPRDEATYSWIFGDAVMALFDEYWEWVPEL